MNHSGHSTLLLLLGSLLLSACSQIPKATLEPQETLGLNPIETKVFDELYIRPGANFTQYKKLYIKPMSISYSDQRRDTSPLYKAEDFQLDEKEMEYFQAEFVKAITKQWQWEITDQPGPDVVSLDIAVNDFYLYGSIKNDLIRPNSTLTYESSKMTLLAKLSDSQSNEQLLISKDKRTTGRSKGMGPMRRLTPVLYWNDAYHAFNRWAANMSTHIQ